jgi:hypothetical protein
MLPRSTGLLNLAGWISAERRARGKKGKQYQREARERATNAFAVLTAYVATGGNIAD